MDKKNNDKSRVVELTDFQRLQKDIKELGIPEISQYRHGFYYGIKPTKYETQYDSEIKFEIGDQGFFKLCIGDVELKQVKRPGNVIVKCKKCYSIVQKAFDSNEVLGYLYWPE